MRVIRRHEVSDAQWEAIRGLIPRWRGRGRRPRDPRDMLNGMMWILRTGAPWRDLPERYGPWQSVYHRFRQWQREGVLRKILRRLQLRLDEQGYIEWDLWCIDGSSVRASRAAAGAGKKGGRSSLRITL